MVSVEPLGPWVGVTRSELESLCLGVMEGARSNHPGREQSARMGEGQELGLSLSSPHLRAGPPWDSDCGPRAPLKDQTPFETLPLLCW